jgi:hypothetical protein
MPHISVHTLGKLLVIWGALLPFIVLPYTTAAIDRVVPLVDNPVTFPGSCIGSLVLRYPDIIAGSLAIIGLGLSSLVLSNYGFQEGKGCP